MSGNLTAPALYALRHPQAGDELRDLIDSEFNNAGGLPRAIELVNAGGGIESARTLARCHAEQVAASRSAELAESIHHGSSCDLHPRFWASSPVEQCCRQLL